VSRATFARAVGPEEWKRVQKELGYDRDFSISRDWHVGYDKGTYRGVPAYWLTHSAIEWIFTLDGEQGKSRARRGSRSALSDERLLKLACVGMCGEFAAALHREFGYPLGAFYEVGPDGWKAGDYTLLHAFAYHPSGKLVDSKGVRSKAQMKSELYTMDGGKVEEHPTTEGDLEALSMEGLDTEVLEAARSYLQRNRAAFDADAGRAARRGSRALDFDFFEDEPEPQASPETRARRAFEAAAGALPETIDASDLFRAWPEGVDERVLIVQRYVRGAVPGWFVYAPSARTEAEGARDRADGLLLNMLPRRVVDELKAAGSYPSRHIPAATVLFTDFQGFTAASERMAPTDLVAELERCFGAFDRIVDRNGVEKVKTIGDAYMAIGGAPIPNRTHPVDCVLAALQMRDHMSTPGPDGQAPLFARRIGVHTGPLVAGVIGERRLAYDVWGDTVNTASRMESSGAVGRVNVSAATWAAVQGFFVGTPRGKVAAKGKGEVEMVFVDGLRPALSVDGRGQTPNGAFWALRGAL
jgi:class 3 adenylate cyclase